MAYLADESYRTVLVYLRNVDKVAPTPTTVIRLRKERRCWLVFDLPERITEVTVYDLDTKKALPSDRKWVWGRRVELGEKTDHDFLLVFQAAEQAAH